LQQVCEYDPDQDAEEGNVKVRRPMGDVRGQPVIVFAQWRA
jgi:hypothetical protein